MPPIFFTISGNIPIKAIPDTQAHLDGHTVLAYNYNIFFDSSKTDHSQILSLEMDKIDDPDYYYGSITIEKPGHLFTYTPGDNRKLTRTEVEEVIEQLSNYRDNPNLWQIRDN